MGIIRLISPVGVLLALTLVISACPGKDYMPIYFPQAESSADVAPDEAPAPAESAQCTLQFTANLCVTIQGDNVSVGNHEKGDDPLCVDIATPIPIEVNGSDATLRGERFPDIVVEGHGLPVPITINGRGNTDGTGNIGDGILTSDGSLTINNFDFYVSALDSVGVIPNLTLTTGNAPPLADVAPIAGSPIAPDGQLTLVTSTLLGSLFPSADKYLQGAAMTAVFRGTVTPPLDQCSGAGGQPTQFEVTKLVVDSQGHEVAVPIPNGNLLEIATGAFIARDSTDIGERFEATAKFRVQNITSSAITLQVPPLVGPFTMASTTSLNQKLPADGSMLLRITFRPVPNLIEEPGTITESFNLGADTFYLTGVALDPQGRTSIDLIDRNGMAIRERIDLLHVGGIAVPASPFRGYFQCQTMMCGGSPLPTQCQPCLDVSGGTCQLLTIGSEGEPLDEVDTKCELRYPHAHEVSVINIGGDNGDGAAPISHVLAIRNTGTAPLTIEDIRLEEIAESHSTGQFLFQPQTPFPITLPVYNPPLDETRAYVVVAYSPTDLLGVDGHKAGVGTTVTDQAMLHVTGDGIDAQLRLKGTTTIKDIPSLQVFFKGTTGLTDRPDGTEYAFRGITMQTADLGVPLYVRLTDSATRPVRITGMKIVGPDATAFELLDSAEEIAKKLPEDRCTIPVFGPDGGVIDVLTDVQPVSLAPNGYDLTPGGTTLDSMPFFGCVNFRRDPSGGLTQRQYLAQIVITAQELGPDKQPIKNPDGSIKQSEFQIPLRAVIDPIKGPMVFRLSQTMSVMLNPQFPGVAAMPSHDEADAYIAVGQATEADRALFTGAILLDPFDEETIYNESGEVVSTPGDGITVIFRAIDTRPSDTTYEDPLLHDYLNLIHDAAAPEGSRGPFFDFPNVPDDFRVSGLRIYTKTLSHPGPLALPDEKPEQPSQCEQVDPCTLEGQRKYSEGPTEPGKKGVCTFFYTSAGAFDSPALRYPDDMPGGERRDLCDDWESPQKLNDIVGSYTLDGHLDFDLGLSFRGPTYFHNPYGPLGSVPPLNEVWHYNFTTKTLVPPKSDEEVDLIPDKRVNRTKQEYKINLNDPETESPQICPNNTRNVLIGSEMYSTWRSIEPFMSRDPEGLIPAGCPEPTNNYAGGTAFIHGRPVDHETGIFSVAAVAKFSANDELTFAFKDVIIFVLMNGWLCDPAGDPEFFEGARCYDLQQNQRDFDAHISILRK